MADLVVARECSIRPLDDGSWLLSSAMVVLSMQAGFAMIEVGSVQSTNAVNIMMKNMADLCFGALAWWTIGWGIAFGASQGGFIGSDQFFGGGLADHSLWFFQYSFAATASTIDSGAIAGRFSFFSYICLSVFLTGWTYPVVAHWVWANGGILSRQGYIDFAGSSVVHVVGGASGLIAAWWVGPRQGRFAPKDHMVKSKNEQKCSTSQTRDSSAVHPDAECDESCDSREDVRVGDEAEERRKSSPWIASFSNSPVSLLYGTFILWIGWYGFNCGSTAALTQGWDAVAGLVAVNTTMAAAAGGMVAMALSAWLTGMVQVQSTSCGILAGLVSITASCHIVLPGEALIIGFVGAIVCFWANQKITACRIDDPCCAAAIHGASGVWGVVATGLFAHENDCAAPVASTTGLANLALNNATDVYGIPLESAGWVRGNEGLLWSGSGRLLVIQIAGVLLIAVWSMANTAAFLWVLENVFRMKARAEFAVELVGLDHGEHGVDSSAGLVQNIAMVHNVLANMPLQQRQTVRHILRQFLELERQEQEREQQSASDNTTDEALSVVEFAGAHGSGRSTASSDSVKRENRHRSTGAAKAIATSTISTVRYGSTLDELGAILQQGQQKQQDQQEQHIRSQPSTSLAQKSTIAEQSTDIQASIEHTHVAAPRHGATNQHSVSGSFKVKGGARASVRRSFDASFQVAGGTVQQQLGGLEHATVILQGQQPSGA